MVTRVSVTAVAAVLLLHLLPHAFAYGDGGHGHGDMALPAGASTASDVNSPIGNSLSPAPESYFAYPHLSGFIVAHIVLMTIAWLFILPISVVLSLARSKLGLPAQLLFLSVNASGLFLGGIYNRNTPDLYKGNIHHTFGWVVTWIVSAQAVMGLIRLYAAEKARARASEEEAAFIPVSVTCMAQHRRLHGMREVNPYRYSNDSGHGTESPTSRCSSMSPADEPEQEEMLHMYHQRPSGFGGHEKEAPRLWWRKTALDRFLSRKIPAMVSEQGMSLMNMVYGIVDRLILILGFVAMATGIVTFGGIFRGNNVFNGLAHFVKGGIFFWYGMLTLGRWMGCFADIGWAWNVKPAADVVGRRKAAIPSAEFVESFLIFFYGATNVFMEHMAAWGGAWTAQDLEHVSISVMFFGGGLCGMLVESKKIRDLLNTSALTNSGTHGVHPAKELLRAPRTYAFSVNPLPPLIILLLGFMMSSHHQASVVSTMVHKQWGTLFVGASLARAVSYILTYLSPPTSLLPSRPPSEVITAFCLISGGLIFMASNKDTVAAMEAYRLNAMFCFTVTMGLTTFLMAWTILVLAIKGWAVRRAQVPSFNTRISA